MFAVVVTEKGGGKQRLEFVSETVRIGRIRGNDVILPRGNVSKNHAVIEKRADGFFLSDVGSTNGTYINGRRVLEPHLVEPDDKIYVGDFILNIEESATPSEPSEVEVSEKASKAVASSGSVPSAPSSAARVPVPTEKRIPLPSVVPPPPKPKDALSVPVSGTGRISSIPAPVTPHNERPAKDGSANLIDSLIVQAAKQLGLPDMVSGPTTLDEKDAGRVRKFIFDAVDNLAEGGRLPKGHLPGRIKARAFRRAADLGPLGLWLQDPSIRKIRILSPSEIFLFTDGKWASASQTYPSKDALEAAAMLLSLGNLPSSHKGIGRFYTEDGALVHTTGNLDKPFITVDKTSIIDDEDFWGEAEQQIISEAIKSGAKILVVGSSSAARRAIFLQILKMLPTRAFIAAVGEIRSSDLAGRRQVTADLSPVFAQSPETVRTALRHTLSMSPDWLAITGLAGGFIPDVLAAAASRLSIAAELPLGGKGILSRELAVAMCASGLSVASSQAAIFLTEAFDVIAVSDCTHDETVYIKSILSTGLSERGSWSPRVLFNRDITE